MAAGLVEGGCAGLAALVLAELARMGNTLVRPSPTSLEGPHKHPSTENSCPTCGQVFK